MFVGNSRATLTGVVRPARTVAPVTDVMRASGRGARLKLAPVTGAVLLVGGLLALSLRQPCLRGMEGSWLLHLGAYLVTTMIIAPATAPSRFRMRAAAGLLLTAIGAELGAVVLMACTFGMLHLLMDFVGIAAGTVLSAHAIRHKTRALPVA